MPNLQPQQPPSHQTRIIKLPDVMKRLGCSRSTIYAKLSPGSSQFDRSMPAPISLGGRAVGWLDHEIEAYLQERIAIRDSRRRTLNQQAKENTHG